MIKLPLTLKQSHHFEGLLRAGLNEIDEEKYWLSYGRFMITHAPKAYIAWEDRTYWLVLVDFIGEDHKYVENGPDGVHILEMTPNRFRYKWCDETMGCEHAALVYAAWDWCLDGEGAENAMPLTSKEQRIIERNTIWTNNVHDRMEKKYPSEDYWK